MTDVTAQAFREAAAAYRRKGSRLDARLTPQEMRVAERNRRSAELMDAAAEQREQLDIIRDALTGLGTLEAQLRAQIATLTAERDEARATLALLTKHPTTNPLQRELLDLITLMPDAQTQELLGYITDLRAIRQRRDAPARPA
jgi:uncharacterized coiled-coil protein SlyX